MISQSILSELKKVVGPEHLLTEKEDMLTYSYDAAILDSQMPFVRFPCSQLPVRGQGDDSH
ncbi:MAG: hypothetical protein ABIJ59_20710 [Pseudomonadota bacterium]